MPRVTAGPVTAAFLALALGLAVGHAAPRPGPPLRAVAPVAAPAAGDDAAAAGEVTAGLLAGTPILLVVAPGASPRLVTDVAAALRAAGAAPGGRLVLRPALLDPVGSALVDDVSAKVVPAGFTPPPGGALERAAAELALVVAGPPAITAGEAGRVTGAFGESGLAVVTPGTGTPAAAVVLSGPGSDPSPVVRALVRTLRVVVVVGRPGGAPPGAYPLRGAASAQGRLLLVLAVRAGLAGTLPGLPPPTPAAVATPAATPAATSAAVSAAPSAARPRGTVTAAPPVPASPRPAPSGHPTARPSAPPAARATPRRS